MAVNVLCLFSLPRPILILLMFAYNSNIYYMDIVGIPGFPKYFTCEAKNISTVQGWRYIFSLHTWRCHHSYFIDFQYNKLKLTWPLGDTMSWQYLTRLLCLYSREIYQHSMIKFESPWLQSCDYPLFIQNTQSI